MIVSLIKLRARNRGKQFCRQTVMNILKNQFYFGAIVYDELSIKNHHKSLIILPNSI